MIINNVGYNHCHDADFFINRPEGSGDYLLLLLKTDAVFILDNAETIIPKNSVFIYPKGMPQYYKCLPQQTFENNWIHFLFEPGEEQENIDSVKAYSVNEPANLSNGFYRNMKIHYPQNGKAHKNSAIFAQCFIGQAVHLRVFFHNCNIVLRLFQYKLH